MLEEYLNSRKQMMLDRINEYSELLEHNKIEKEEAYNKIDELNQKYFLQKPELIVNIKTMKLIKLKKR